MDTTTQLVERRSEFESRYMKQMFHARGMTDNNLFGGDEVNPTPLGGSLLDGAKGLWVQGTLDDMSYWVAVFWRGELGDRVEIRGFDAELVVEGLKRHEGERFSLSPAGPYFPLEFDKPLSILIALLDLGGPTADWGGDMPPELPDYTNCILPPPD